MLSLQYFLLAGRSSDCKKLANLFSGGRKIFFVQPKDFFTKIFPPGKLKAFSVGILQ